MTAAWKARALQAAVSRHVTLGRPGSPSGGPLGLPAAPPRAATATGPVVSIFAAARSHFLSLVRSFYIDKRGSSPLCTKSFPGKAAAHPRENLLALHVSLWRGCGRLPIYSGKGKICEEKVRKGKKTVDKGTRRVIR